MESDSKLLWSGTRTIPYLFCQGRQPQIYFLFNMRNAPEFRVKKVENRIKYSSSSRKKKKSSSIELALSMEHNLIESCRDVECQIVPTRFGSINHACRAWHVVEFLSRFFSFFNKRRCYIHKLSWKKTIMRYEKLVDLKSRTSCLEIVTFLVDYITAGAKQTPTQKIDKIIEI